MIEWWHAVLIAFASSLTTGGIALFIQHRQMDRDVKLQQQRLDADAQERKLQAAREHSKEQMRTLYEFVEVVEQHQSSRFLQMNLGRKEHKESVDSILKTKLDDDTHAAIAAAISAPDISGIEAARRYTGRILTVASPLRISLAKLLTHVATGGKFLTESEVSTLVVEVRDLLSIAIVDPELFTRLRLEADGEWEEALQENAP